MIAIPDLTRTLEARPMPEAGLVRSCRQRLLLDAEVLGALEATLADDDAPAEPEVMLAEGDSVVRGDDEARSPGEAVMLG
ncbi:MAG TPA: hypothetical protein VK009_18370 [Chloroflexota bacterium]|nr:hypothetical protein [Chloroflexota bacterium]